MKTIKLEKSFMGRGETKGFKFTQIKKTPHGYIYEVQSSVKPHYEVFKRKSFPLCIDFVNRVFSDDTMKENYPKQNAFGKLAWTTLSLEKAELILINIDMESKQAKKDGNTT